MASLNSEGKQEWQEATVQTLARLDILNEYGKLGLTFADPPRPNSNGWVQATNDISIGVNVGNDKLRGKFHDFGKGNDKGGSLFDYAVKCGRFSTFVQAKIHYMQLAGVPVPGGDRKVDLDERPVPTLTATPKPAKPKKVHDYTQAAELMFAHAKLHGDHAKLAEPIKVGVFALEKMGVGTWNQDDQSLGIYWGKIACTMWPEFHWIAGKGLIPVTFMRRAWEPGLGKNGKRIIAGGIRGIYAPTGWIDRANRTGFLPVCEGGSDTAAGTTVGLGAIGYPESASVEVKNHLIPMVLAAIRSGRLRADIKIVVTRDRNNSGKLDTGAVSVCQWIADGTGLPVWLRHIPFGEGYFKDVRAWLGHMLDNPHEVADGEADGLGRAFLGHVIGYPDVREPEKDVYLPISEVVSGTSVTTEMRECINLTPVQVPTICIKGLPKDVSLNTDRRHLDVGKSDEPVEHCPQRADSPYYHNDERPGERLRRETLALNPDPEKYTRQWGSNWYALDGTCATPGEPTFAEAYRLHLGLPPLRPAKPHDPLKAKWDTTTLERLLAVRYSLDCGRIGTTTQGHRTEPIAMKRWRRCRCWKCPACRPGERFDWAQHAHNIFRWSYGDFTELFVWRGPQVWFEKNGRKTVNKYDGQYIRVSLGGGLALVVTTVEIKDSVPITDLEAHKQVIAAIAACDPPKSVPNGYQPVRTSKCGPWRKPPHVSSGEWFDMSSSDENQEETERYLLLFGITRMESKRDAVKYSFPVTWDEDTRRYWSDWSNNDKRHAFLWARAQMFPEDWRPGLQVPDPQPLIDALLREYHESVEAKVPLCFGPEYYGDERPERDTTPIEKLRALVKKV